MTPRQVFFHPWRASRSIAELRQAAVAADERAAATEARAREREAALTGRLAEAEDERRRLTLLMSEQQQTHAAERARYEAQADEIRLLQEEFARVDELIASYRRRIDSLKDKLTGARAKLADTRTRLSQALSETAEELSPVAPKVLRDLKEHTDPQALPPVEDPSADWYTSPFDTPVQ